MIERLIRKIQDHIVAIENELNFSFNIPPVKLVTAVNRFRTFKASKPDFKDDCRFSRHANCRLTINGSFPFIEFLCMDKASL